MGLPDSRHVLLLSLQIRNVGSDLCVENKHFLSGTPIRLETCVKGRGDVGWNHGQVGRSLTMNTSAPLCCHGGLRLKEIFVCFSFQ